MSGIIFSESGNAAYSKAKSLLFVEQSNPTVNRSNPSVKTSGSEKIAFWGENNLFPYDLETLVRKNSILSNGILWKTNALTSGGLVYGKIETDQKGNETFIPNYNNKEVNTFLRSSNVNRYLRDAAYEYYKFWNVFPELIFDAARKKIISITCNESMWCRYSNDGGLKENVYINANWDNGGKAEDEQTIVVPCIDPYDRPLTQLSEGKEYKYIWPITGLSSGQAFYAIPPWYSIKESGWYDLNEDIVKLKRSIIKNQMGIMYHVEVPASYWTDIHKDWVDKKPAQRKKIKEDEFKTFTDVFEGVDGAGKTLFTEYKIDSHNLKAYANWIVKRVDEPVKEGIYVEDSMEATIHTYTALGIDQTLVNTPSKGGIGAGSGSDKRVAFSLYMMNCKPDQDLILEPLQTINDYNGWEEDHVFWFKNYHLALMSQVTPSARI